MPRFVILRHEFPAGHARRLHWDLMLEWEGVLRTWALAAEPASQQIIDAEPLPDHRLAYLEYEGPVSGDRGSVSRWDTGAYRLIRDAANTLQIELCGQRLSGFATLEQQPSGLHLWRVSFSAAPTTG